MIWLDESQYCLRIVDGDPAERPPYRAVGTVHRHGDVAILSGFLGQIKRQDLINFVIKMHEIGVCYILISRAGKHKMPFGSAVDAGPFRGWWQIDIPDLLRQKSFGGHFFKIRGSPESDLD